MKKKRHRRKRIHSFPTVEQLEAELERVTLRRQSWKMLYMFGSAVITAAAVAVLVTAFWMPAFRIYGSSMEPALREGEFVLSARNADYGQGDIIAFFHNGRILVKRVIAAGDDWVDMDDDGNVYVNGKELAEPYLNEKAFGETDIVLPYQVPTGELFVLGDHRSASLDSRNAVVGCVSEEQIIGKVLLRIWPLNRFGKI